VRRNAALVETDEHRLGFEILETQAHQTRKPTGRLSWSVQAHPADGPQEIPDPGGLGASS
jgi:hypothetical protein